MIQRPTKLQRPSWIFPSLGWRFRRPKLQPTMREPHLQGGDHGTASAEFWGFWAGSSMGGKRQRTPRWSPRCFWSTIKGGAIPANPWNHFFTQKNLTPSTKGLFLVECLYKWFVGSRQESLNFSPKKETPNKGICWMKCRNLSVSWRGSRIFPPKTGDR